MTSRHRVHVILPEVFGGDNVIAKFGLDRMGKVVVPKQILTHSDWLYDIDAKIVLKNRYGKFRVHLGVQEVEEEWVDRHRFMGILFRPVNITQPANNIR